MKKLIFICSILLIGFNSTAQDKSIYLQSFVKEDTVQLRWAPTSPDLLIKGLKEGYKITRTNLLDNSTTTFEIAALAERKANLLSSTDTNTLFMTSFAVEFTEKTFNSAAEKQAPFFMLSLSSSTDKGIANVCGVYFEDIITNTSQYRYEIQFTTDSQAADQVEVNTKSLNENPDCSALKGFSRIDLKEAYLEWEAKSLNTSYGGYWLMKSTDKKSFKKVNQTPLYFFTSQYEPDKITVDFVDTAVTEGQTYYYKVAPINHFADIGEYSNTVEVYIQKRLNGICKIDTVQSKEYSRFIQGIYETKVAEDDVVEFILYRSNKVDSGFVQIDASKSSDNQFEFEYATQLLSGDRHYFKVAAVSKDKDTVFSFPYYHFSLDQEPPSTPTLFAGIISDEGVAKLTWTAPTDNDLRGYRIMRTNSLKEEFVEITTTLSTETTYFDTLRLDNLTSEIYYKVRAVDLNYNNSENTAPILLMKPDTIAPVASVIKNYSVKEAGIYLSWANSQSEDLKTQYLIRSGQAGTDTILTFMGEINEHLDSTCYVGSAYNYAILTLDKSNNASRSKDLQIRYELGYRLAPRNFGGTVDRKEKNITLEWQPPLDASIYSIQIYRAKNDGRFSLHKTLFDNENTYIDNELSPNNVYHYKIKIVYKTGHSSKMSSPIELVY